MRWGLPMRFDIIFTAEIAAKLPITLFSLAAEILGGHPISLQIAADGEREIPFPGSYNI
jgi:hypothetical protein